MAAVNAFATTRTDDEGPISAVNTAIISWSSVLRALQHPSYISQSVKDTLRSRIKQLQNCADVIQVTPGQCGSLQDSVTIDGLKFDVSQQQKELTKKLTDQLQVNTNEVFKVVYRQTRIGISETDAIIKAYFQERTSQLQVVKCLFNLGSTTKNEKLMALSREILTKLNEDKEFSLKLVQGLKKRLEQHMPPKVASNPTVALAWSRQVLVEEHELVEILFLATKSESISFNVVTSWFSFLRDSSFFSNQRNVRLDLEPVVDILQSVQALAAVLSIQFTSLPETDLVDLAKDKSHFFSNPNSIEQIQDVLKYLTPEIPMLAPAALSWALTMHRLFASLTGEGEEMPRSHAQAITKLCETDEGYIEWHRFFAQLAFEQGAFQIMIPLLETLSDKQSISDIRRLISSLFFSTFHMITFNDLIITTFAAIHGSSPELSAEFWTATQEDTSSPASDLLFSARSRFPLSFLPLLTLLNSSVHPSTKETVFNYLQTLPTYTQVVQRGFTGYEIIQEDRDNTLISLKSELHVFAEREDGEGAVIVHPGAVGRLLSRGESVPTVMWEWPYNGWALLGRVLETILANGVRTVLASDETYFPVLVGIFKLLEGVLKGSSPAFVESVVNAASEEMAQEWDVISVTYEIVNQALEVLDLGVNSHDELESLLSVSEAGMKILAAAIEGRESSIWPLIVKGGSKWWGRISRIAISSEMPSLSLCFPVTISTIELVDSLFSAAVANAVVSDGFSSHLRREVLWLAGGYALDTWLSFNEWKYINPQKRFEIGTNLCQLFDRILSQVYMIDALHSPENRVTGIITPSADRVLEMFLAQENEMGRPFESLFYACYIAKEVFETRDDGLEAELVRKAVNWSLSSLALSETIIRTRPLVAPDALGFELQIYRQLKLLNSLLFLRPSLQRPIFSLLRTLLLAPQQENREQPSILAHLGGDEKTHIPLLIELATDPIIYPETRRAVWKYAAGIMASQQQGLAILLLFGAETGRKTAHKPAVVEDKEETETLLRKAVTMVVEDELKPKDMLERQVFGIHTYFEVNIDAIVDFLSKAHNSWAPILSTLRQDKALWAKLLILLAWSGTMVDSAEPAPQTLQNCWRLHTAAAAVDAIAVEVFHAGNMSQAASIEVLRDLLVTKKDIRLQDIASEAFRIRGYRDSLFFHLRRNFQSKFPNSDILRFQRSVRSERQFGEEYFFDISIGRAILEGDSAWAGFEKEIRLANLNMSIVDAQLELLASWQHLALAWAETGHKTLPLDGWSVIMTKACLESNIAEAKMHALLRATLAGRATLAFSLVENPSLKIGQQDVGTILRLAFNALAVPDLSYLDALTDGKFDVCRPLMQIILVCLNRLDRTKDRHSGLLDLFEAIVAKGATNLLNRARISADEQVAEMVKLVIAIAQNLVDLSSRDIIFSELCNKLMDHNTIEAAVRLYGAGHQCLIDDQPIFAELSLSFLVALCPIPRVPEQIAVAGILAFVMESPISSVIQSNDIRTPNSLVLHRVWTRGVLPMIFSLLQSLGTRIIRDVVAFFRLYEHQIQSAFAEWARPKFVTTALVDETLLLLVLFEVVDTYLRMEQDRFVFRGKEDLLENVNNLLAHPRFLARLVHPTSVEEEKMMEERKEGEFKNALVAKVAADLVEVRGLLGVVEQ